MPDTQMVRVAREAFKKCRPVDRVVCQDFGMQQDDILDQQLEAALEAALSGHVVGWRTMDSAPKDGTIILGYWIPVPNAAPGSNSFGLTKFVDGNWWDSDDTEQEYRQPDYWQTLNVPAPPVPEMEG